MNRITAITIYIALTAAPGMFAQAQPASTRDAIPEQTQRAGERVIRCTYQEEGGVRGLLPCGVRQTDGALRIGSNVSREEFECRLSGNCGVDDRARVNS